MWLQKAVGALALMCASTGWAQTVYKCPTQGGGTMYSQAPCAGEKLEVRTAPPPSGLPAEYQARSDAIDRKKRDIAAHCKGKEIKTLVVGMRKEDAFCVSFSYAFPDSINTTSTADGVREQYVFNKYVAKASYLYFTDGVLTAIQN